MGAAVAPPAGLDSTMQLSKRQLKKLFLLSLLFTVAYELRGSTVVVTHAL